MVDPTKPLPLPSDPWEGRATVPSAVPAPAEPQVIFVEVQRKRRWPWVLGIFALLGLLCCGICGFALSPVFHDYPSHIAATPAAVEGLKRNDEGQTKIATEEAKFRIAANKYVDESFANLFNEPGAPARNVITFGGTGLIWDPEGTMSGLVQSAGENLRTVNTYDPGKMGGILKCGDSHDDKDAPIVLCAWIDHGSLGIGAFYGGRSKDDSAKFLRTLRESIIIRP